MSSCQVTRRRVGHIVRRFGLAGLLLSCAAGGFFAASGSAVADDTTSFYRFTGGVSTDWMDPNNWTDVTTGLTGTAPGPGSAVDINGGTLANPTVVTIGTVANPAPTITIESAYLGQDGDAHGPVTFPNPTPPPPLIQYTDPTAGYGTLNQNSGTLNINGANGWMKLGAVNGSGGTYNMSATATFSETNDVLSVGEHGTGVLTVMDTSSLTTTGMAVGRWGDGTGSVVQGNIAGTDSPTVTINGQLSVGAQGQNGGSPQTQATYTQNSGSVSTTKLDIAGATNSNGAYTLNNSATLTSSGDIVVGDTGTGVFTQNNGTVTQTGGWTYVGLNPGATGTYIMNGGTLQTNGWLAVGERGTGVFTQTGGLVATSDTLWIGPHVGGNGTYNLSGGTLTVQNDLRVGDNRDGAGPGTGFLNIHAGGTLIHTQGDVHIGENGTGTVTQDGGVASYETGTGSNWVKVGQGNGTGTYNLSGGTANVIYNGGQNPWLLVGTDSSSGNFNISGTGDLESASMWIGQSTSTGIVNQSGGVVNLGTMAAGSTGSGNFKVGQDTGHGTYNISGGTLNTSQDMEIGDDGGVGVVNQTGGTVNTNGGWVRVGNGGNAGESGTYTISAGTLSSGRVISGPGGNSHGTITQTGGVVTSTNDASIGDGVGSVATYTISGASSGPNAVVLNTGLGGNENGNASMGLLLGWGGLGNFNQNGGVVNVGNEGIGFNSDGNNASGNGVYNLSGGILNTAAVFKIGAAGTATFNFNGGTLRVSGFTGNRPFFMGPGNANLGDGQPLPALTAANVQAGGAIIDTNSFNITISQPLLHDPALGPTLDGGLTVIDSSVGPAGILTLTGANTYTGPTNVLTNTLNVGNTLALQNSTVNLTVANSVQFSPAIGAFTFGGLKGTADLSLLDTGAAPVTLSVGNNNSSNSYSGVMSGALAGLTKVGTGSLTLTTSQTYTGPTVVNGGTLNLPLGVSLASPTLAVGGAAALPGSSPTISGNGTVGALTVNGVGGTGDAGHVAPGANTIGNFGAVGTLHVGGAVALNGGSMLDIDVGALGAGNSDLIAATGALTLPVGGSGTVTVNLNNLGGFALGTYQLITTAPGGATNFSPTAFSVGTGVPGFQVKFTNPSGEVDMIVSAAPTWAANPTGTPNNDWNQILNWVNSIRPGVNDGTTTNTDTANFSLTSTVTNPLPDLNRNVQNISFDTAAASAYVIGTTGAMGGNALLLTTGGKIQMTSTVTNTETVNAPLVLEGASGTYAFSNNAADNTKLLIIGGGVTGGAAGNTVLTLSGSNTGTLAGVNAVNGVIANGLATSLGIAKTGGGVWLLGGNNTFTGGASIDAGVLAVGNAGALNAAAPNAVFFGPASTGILALNGISVTISGLNSTSAAATVVDGNPANATLTVNSLAPSSFNGVLADGPLGGHLNLVVSGGSQTLSGNGTFTGTTDVTGIATLNLGSTNALQNSTLNMTVVNSVQFNSGVGVFTLGGLQGNGNMALIDAGSNAVVLSVGNNGGSTTYSGVLSGPGALTKVGAGTLTLTNANTYAGTTTISGGTLQLGDGAALNGSIDASANIVNNATLAFANPNPQTYIGVISGTGAVTKSAAGTLTLTNSSTYSGGTTISAGRVNVGPAPLSSTAGPLGTGTVTLTGTTPTLSLQGVTNVGLAAQFYNSAPANTGNQDPAYNALSTLNAKLNALTPAVTVSTVVGGKADLNFTSGGTLGAGGFTGGGNRDYIFNKTGPTTALYGFPPVNVGTVGEDNFQVRLSGFINITNADTYTFTTTSDDGSVLFIDGGDGVTPNDDIPLVNNNMYQGMTVKTGSVALTAGLHAITIGYYEGGGGLGLGATYQDASGLGDTGGVMVAIPNSVLSLVNGGQFGTQSYPNALAVTTNSTVNIANALTASMGPLSLGAVTLNVTSSDATVSPYSLTFNGASTLTGNGTINVANSTSGGLGQVNINALGESGGSHSLTKTGPGVLSMTGNGTYSGGTILAASSGLVIANNPGSIGTGPATLNSSTTLRVVAGSPSISNSTLSGFNNGTGWTANTVAILTPAFSGNTLTLTDGVNNESRSVFFNTKQSVAGNLAVGFTYTATGTGTLADGAAVIFQNDPRGTAAIGANGGGLGYSGITPSAAYEFNVYPPNTVGSAVNVNGAIGPSSATGSVNVASGDPINVVLVYDATGLTLTEVLTDTVTNSTFTKTTVLPDTLANLTGGPTAFFGFSGATGGSNSTQVITNLSLGSGASSVYANSVVVTGGSHATIDVGSTVVVSTLAMGSLTVGNGAGTTLNLTATTAPIDTAYGLSLGPATINGNLAINIAANGIGAGTLTLTGPANLAAGVTINHNSGTLRINNTSGPATVGAGVTVNVASGATLELAGSVSGLSGAGLNPPVPANRAHVVNAGTVLVSGTNQQVGAIDGTGTTTVNDGSSLTANHIVQSALVIGATGASPSLVTIAASDASGNSLAESSGLALAGSLHSSSSLASGTLGSSSMLAATGSSNGASAVGSSLGTLNAGGSVAAVPEPSSIVLVVLGALACLLPAMRRRKARNASPII